MTFSILKYLLKKFITTKSVLIKFKEKDHLIDNNTDPLILKINNDKFLKKNSLRKNEINYFLKRKNSYSIGVWNESCGWISPVSFIKACFDDSKKKLKRKLEFITNCKINSIKKKTK